MKAVIVIDVDENKIGNEVNYISIGDTVLYIGKKVRVKPLPQKKDIDKTLEFGGYENIIQESLARGYNACLEEIQNDN